jgi:hypothetical protein
MDLMNDIIDSESLENVDIEVELQHALELKEYRQAIRWLYLQNLKLMIQKGLLRPSPEKTNQDYLSEIQSLEFQEGFLHLTRIFERIWYGHRLPDRSAFLDWKAQFDHYYQLIRLNS